MYETESCMHQTCNALICKTLTIRHTHTQRLTHLYTTHTHLNSRFSLLMILSKNLNCLELLLLVMDWTPWERYLYLQRNIKSYLVGEREGEEREEWREREGGREREGERGRGRKKWLGKRRKDEEGSEWQSDTCSISHTHIHYEIMYAQ